MELEKVILSKVTQTLKDKHDGYSLGTEHELSSEG